jgi:hypothetical protein
MANINRPVAANATAVDRLVANIEISFAESLRNGILTDGL